MKLKLAHLAKMYVTYLITLEGGGGGGGGSVPLDLTQPTATVIMFIVTSEGGDNNSNGV